MNNALVDFLRWLFLTPQMEMTMLHGLAFVGLTAVIIFLVATISVAREMRRLNRRTTQRKRPASEEQGRG